MKRTHLLSAALVLSLSSLSSLAVADPKAAPPKAPEPSAAPKPADAKAAAPKAAEPKAEAKPAASEPKNDRGYAYTFSDDSMLGSGIASNGIMIPVLAKARKDVLIRPRLQFVQQMIKSVESL
jgi:hypothetical protein